MSKHDEWLDMLYEKTNGDCREVISTYLTEDGYIEVEYSCDYCENVECVNNPNNKEVIYEEDF